MNDLNIYNILNYENYDQLVQLFTENGACQFYSSIYLHSLDITLNKEEPIKYLNKKNQNQFGIIKEIVCLNLKNKNQLPLIKISVLQTSQFVSQYVSTKIADWLESRELFSCQDTKWICWSGTKQTFLILEIQGKILLVKHEEIEDHVKSDKEAYFMRASFNHYTKQFNPPYDQWKRSFCICGNPDNNEKGFVKCDICKVWYHTDCEGITLQQFDRLNKNTRLPYSCNKCKIVKKKKR
ncbi:unnamed protein product (macronuclear) [Paramecium tetraurelia]|uniref:PHD-type domain-containing protein n=1 Tax=Paramecium tetraurelia TaxID=5888 RepID=A0DIL3_PARTE|nr:uncharacterized protein GSPATT00017237001 [Paramecium tetraurelia]CAK82880.1 unnamed protein product [Paramecium tetraurelia]|eukprot:XP_001450277.1 hypothetical protein (macronuclear) [Paramecium tetraurelia strain d4-2]